ncbi:hypothetical protein AOLI_G00268760 [Acnodon oligacanthus]
MHNPNGQKKQFHHLMIAWDLVPEEWVAPFSLDLLQDLWHGLAPHVMVQAAGSDIDVLSSCVLKSQFMAFHGT